MFKVPRNMGELDCVASTDASDSDDVFYYLFIIQL